MDTLLIDTQPDLVQIKIVCNSNNYIQYTINVKNVNIETQTKNNKKYTNNNNNNSSSSSSSSSTSSNLF